jgi:hypothetical protein
MEAAKEIKKERAKPGTSDRYAAQKSYYQRNKDKCKERIRKWHEQNKERYAVTSRIWWENNKERKAETSKKWNDRNPYSRLIAASKVRAQKRGIEHTLTLEWAKETWTGKCALTGIDFICRNGKTNPFSPSIDRIDPAKGYTPENSRFILFRLNALKSSDTDDANALLIAEAFVKMAKAKTKVCPTEVL